MCPCHKYHAMLYLCRDYMVFAKFEKYKNHLNHNVFLFKMRFFFFKKRTLSTKAYTKKESKVFLSKHLENDGFNTKMLFFEF